MSNGYFIRTAVHADADALLELLPDLASFELPSGRVAEHLWQGDAELLTRWYRGEAPDSHVHVAVADDEAVLGLTIVTLRPELLSGEPSAHLEAIVVSQRARRTGVGQALLAHTERAVLGLGARSMTLHVFARNTKARDFYARCGYDGELMRYIKPLIYD